MEVVDERHLNTFEQIININTRSLPGHHLNAFLAYIVHRLQSNITIPRSLSYTTTLPTPTKTRHVITTINRPHIILYKPFTQPIHPSIMTSQMTLWHSYERKSSWCRTFLLFVSRSSRMNVDKLVNQETFGAEMFNGVFHVDPLHISTLQDSLQNKSFTLYQDRVGRKNHLERVLQYQQIFTAY